LQISVLKTTSSGWQLNHFKLMHYRITKRSSPTTKDW
jgi:hypothetical protein